MRTKAFILFIPFLVFMAETFSFIPAMQQNCSIVATKPSCAKPAEPLACETESEDACCSSVQETEACGNDTDSNNETPGSCDSNPDCSTCPVCYMFILQSRYELDMAAFFIKKNYNLLNTSNISSYKPDVWKPPNSPLLHT